MSHDSPFHRLHETPPLSRREFLFRSGGGLGGIALAGLLGGEKLLAAGGVGFMQFPPKAKRVVQLFMAGAASHVDMWDHKPELAKRNGEKWDPGEGWSFSKAAPARASRRRGSFRRMGRAGRC